MGSFVLNRVMSTMKKRQKKKKKKKKRVSNPQTRSSSIPPDLIFEIFSRLPAKSISRFRCLSKEWESTFHSRDFTRSFSTRSRPRLLFAFHVDCKLCSYSAPPQSHHKYLSPVLFVDKHMPIRGPGSGSAIPPPVRGLLCPSSTWYAGGRRDSKMMTVCNPSTGQIRKLPAARTKGFRFHVRTYLGYDPIKEEYKVLFMSLSGLGVYPSISEDHQVLTLGTGKPVWRRVECSLQHFPVCGGICIDGVLYYSAFRDNEFGGGRVYSVVCFDVGSEKFEPLEISSTCSPTLINYKGKLGAIQFDSGGFYDGRTTSLGLMVLDDAEQHKWSKITYTLPPFWKELRLDGRILRFDARRVKVGMTGDSEILFSPSILSDPFYIFYHDLVRNTTVIVRVKGIDFDKRQESQNVYTYLDHVEDVQPM